MKIKVKPLFMMEALICINSLKCESFDVVYLLRLQMRSLDRIFM